MESNYLKKTYLYGRIATLIGIGLMLGIPALICWVYDIWPTPAQVIAAAGPLLAMYIPSAVSENISMIPVQGSSVYMNSILGNVMNIKFPCYLNAIEKMDTTPGTELADALGMCVVTISGMVTMVIIALGLLLMAPLEPVLTSQTVKTATSYIMPALYGSMGISAFISTGAGMYKTSGKPTISLIAVALVLLVNFFVVPITGKEGYAMLIMLIVTVLIAWVLYKQGIVKVEDK
ncbi:hypothetical protein O6R05_05780 [Peptoniphilus equinus]|uniref:Uncharacterized protein n=1 Tax=Peptoniphilus equinus TaxID=3016343 RepID=A0ABY7QRW0_9FIRM|nr:hypothetical protein [Peptoniphilus equinus]WBW49518.1 hypothetical protein O6R05_05780 [Peptoniphilus equinus]